MQANDGNLYGTTWEGGGGSNRGTIFKITTSGALTTLYNFSGADGTNPGAALVQARDGNFYGTTVSGGTYAGGTVFKITPAGELTTLHSFEYSDGQYPFASLIQAHDGNFYGTTMASGGPYGYGTIFKITPAGDLTLVWRFGGRDGSNPEAGLVQTVDGNFYGTTCTGGAYNYGTIFRLSIVPACVTCRF